jgi:hypothetical protein
MRPPSVREQLESRYNLLIEPSIDTPGELAHLKMIALAGFAVALHVHLTTPAYLFQTYSTKWIEDYGRKRLAMQDPVVA